MQHAYLSDEQIDADSVMQLGYVLRSRCELEEALSGHASTLNCALNAALVYQYICKTGFKPDPDVLPINEAAVQFMSRQALSYDFPTDK